MNQSRSPARRQWAVVRWSRVGSGTFALAGQSRRGVSLGTEGAPDQPRVEKSFILYFTGETGITPRFGRVSGRKKSVCQVVISRGLWSWALPGGSDPPTEFLNLLLQQTPPDTTTALQFAVLLS